MKTLHDVSIPALSTLLANYGIVLSITPANEAIPGSYWGNPEAGVIASAVYASSVTPIHSVLHETAHIICMGAERRASLHTDAGGTDDEEEAVCYLQTELAARLAGYSSDELFDDMDAWGYSFRQGKALRWWQEDGAAAKDWLVRHSII